VILLDTNVVSESLQRQPDVAVVAWIDKQPFELLYVCTPVLAELRYGIERLDTGARKALLQTAVDHIETDLYRGRILAFDIAASREYGRLFAARRKIGQPIGRMDAFVAAIALSQGAGLATRNTRHFADLGLDLINPFELASSQK
jgi:predicted nucleic acid-binding protein